MVSEEFRQIRRGGCSLPLGGAIAETNSRNAVLWPVWHELHWPVQPQCGIYIHVCNVCHCIKITIECHRNQ